MGGSHSDRRSDPSRFALSKGVSSAHCFISERLKSSSRYQAYDRQGWSVRLPLKAQAWGDAISKEGDTRPRVERPLAHYRFVSEHYFETMGVALRQGRFPASHDRTQRAALVSESAARKVWPGENPIGKLIRNDPKPGWAAVIGVVADVRPRAWKGSRL